MMIGFQNREHHHSKTHSTMHPLAAVELTMQNDSKSISANYHGDLLHNMMEVFRNDADYVLGKVCMFLMNLMRERMSSGSAVRTTCDMKKEATPETLRTLLPPLLRRSRKQMQPRKSATPAQPVAASIRRPACRTASLLDSLKSGSPKNTCPNVKSMEVRRMRREAARTMASNAEPYRKGFVPTRRTAKGVLANTAARNALNWLHM